MRQCGKSIVKVNDYPALEKDLIKPELLDMKRSRVFFSKRKQKHV